MNVGIITIGNELLSGFTLDRNAAWIGQQLLSSGIKVSIHHTIPDDLGVISVSYTHLTLPTKRIV